MTIALSRSGVHHNDIKRLKIMVDPRQFSVNLGGRYDMPVRQMPEIELDARAIAPFQRHLVDGDRPLAFVHGGMVVIGRIDMGAVMGGDVQPLDRPALAARQILLFQARKEHHDLFGGLLVIHVLDLGQHDRRVRGDACFQRDGEVNVAAGHVESPV